VNQLPAFAKPIADARAAGKRPAALVIVSDGDHGLHRIYPGNPVVSLRETDDPTSFDWWWLADLDVEIATVGGARRTQALIDAIQTARPYYLRVWRLDTNEMTRVQWLGSLWMTPEWNL
jgi:hypothetical protein